MTRAVKCVDAKLQPAAASACKALTMPMTQLACNTAPCVGHSWQVKALQPLVDNCSAYPGTQ